MPHHLISSTFKERFAELTDPRVEGRRLYPLEELLFVVICGTICGVEGWRDYVAFGEEKLDFLKRYFAFKEGIASKNTYARVFAALDHEQFKSCFIEWMSAFQLNAKEVIAIDGKTLCNSRDKASNLPAIHLVSAFATESRLVLAQQKVEDKSNEITAIPKLLELLELTNNIVTIDAMGCQKEIAKKIREKEADYIFSLKGNQGTLNEDVSLFLRHEAEAGSPLLSCYEEVDKGHGRIETRRCVASSQLDWLQQKPLWADLQSIAMIEEVRQIGEKTSVECRFFISSLPADAKLIAASVRAHWAIENALHWTLDVVFNEDLSRVRKDHAGLNMALIRHMTLNMLNNARKQLKGVGLKALRKKAGWGNASLEMILKQSF